MIEYKRRSIDTPEVRMALDLLAPLIRPDWLIPQFRFHIGRDGQGDVDLEGHQQVLRATFLGIRDGVGELLGKRWMH